MTKPKILICDDDQSLVQNLLMLLSESYDPVAALTVDEGIAILKNSVARVDIEARLSVVIIDLSFQTSSTGFDLDGLSVLKEAMRDQFIEPIIFTGHGSAVSFNEMASHGPFRFISKGGGVGSPVINNLKASIAGAIACRNSVIGIARAIERFRLQRP